MRVVPALDVPEDGEPDFDVHGEAMRRQTLDFKRRGEAFDHRAIVSIATRAH